MEEIYKKLTEYILEWNEKINVTAIRDPNEFYEKNIRDSLEVMNIPQFMKGKRILDLGTGGGFPGLPLAIACPDKEFYLLDSVAKKLKVVSAAAEEFHLDNVDVLNMRAEDMAKWPAYRETFDAVVSRAVANMSTLSEYCLPFVKKDGYFIAYKTEDAREEIEAAKKAISILGGEIEDIVPDSIEGSGHLFVIVRKIKTTPPKFPRKAGLPSKDPLK